ncbi:hypothetical protein PYCC9005_002828 [Savitreella phatthalungensis]
MLVVLDFDETISVDDTMAVLASASPLFGDGGRWRSFVSAYTDDLAAFDAAAPTRHTLDDLLAHLARLRTVELASVSRITGSGYFAGTTHARIAAAADAVTLRQGFHDFVHTQEERGVQLGILSVHWSRTFICAATGFDLDAVVGWGSGRWVVANELVFGEDAKATGGCSKVDGVLVGEDKRRVIAGLMEEEKQQVVYVGDSNTDLPALLQAHVGVIMGHNESLANNCNRFGVQVRPYREYTKGQKGLYRVANFAELQALIDAIHT